jgi:ammonium transporter Rh
MEIFVSSSTINKFWNCFTTVSDQLLTTIPLLLTLFGSLFTHYYISKYPNEEVGEVGRLYSLYQDVHVMIFVGFGFLMNFPQNYKYSALLHTLLIGVVSVLVTPMINLLWHNIILNEWDTLSLNISNTLIASDFGAGAMLIAYGSHLGKLTTLQTYILTLFGLIFYSLNETIGVYQLKVVDMGGSMFVHTFGALYGVSASFARGYGKEIGQEPKPDKTSDTFAMLGSIFLWMFWPSFNGALATGSQQHRVVTNTVFALSSSAITSIALSPLFTQNKYDMVFIQNCILAGGVAVGSASDLIIGAWGALLLGFVGALTSIFGYKWLTPCLRKYGLNDTCGVLNLHGLPGIVGGLGGMVSAIVAGENAYGQSIENVWSARDERSAFIQGMFQLAALVVTIGISILSGLVSGFLVGVFEKTNWDEDEDSNEWKID